MPLEYIEYALCKKFHWTITELDDQPKDRILQFLTIMRIEAQFEHIEQQKQQAEMQSRG